MLLRALAATSAEGWEQEEEKLSSSRVVADSDRIKNVDDVDEPPLKPPTASPSTFGSFLGARGVASGRALEDAKDRASSGEEAIPSKKKNNKAPLSDSLAAAKDRFLPSSTSTPSSLTFLSLATLPVSCAARAGDALLPASFSDAAARLLDGAVDAAASVVLSSKNEEEKSGAGVAKQEGQRQRPLSSSSSRPASSASRLGRLAAAAVGLASESKGNADGDETRNGSSSSAAAVVVVEAQLLSSPLPERLALPASTPVAEVLERVVEATTTTKGSAGGTSTATAKAAAKSGEGTERRRLTFLLAEDRPRVAGGGGRGAGGGRLPAAAGLARTARAAAKRLAAPAAVTDPRSSSPSGGGGAAGARGALLAWAHFLLLPEPVNRELRGQGLVGWVRGSAAWRAVASGAFGEEETDESRERREEKPTSYASSLLRLLAKTPLSARPDPPARSSQRPRRRMVIRADAPTLPPPPRGSTPVRVELRDGSVLRVVARPGATLGAFSASIERDLGILEEAQRFLVVEEPEPGLASRVAGAAALAALRFSAGLAASAARRAASVAGTAAAVVGVKGGKEDEGDEEEDLASGGAFSSSSAGPFSIVVRSHRRKKKSSPSSSSLPLEFEVAPEATMAQVKAAVDAALLAEAEAEGEEGGEGNESGDASESESSSSSSSGDENGDKPRSVASISLVFPGRSSSQRSRRRAAAAGGAAGGGTRRKKPFASEIVRIEAAV